MANVFKTRIQNRYSSVTVGSKVAQSSTMAKSFRIPSALHDLERAPYNLLPYPEDFEDDDEAARAESFDVLVLSIETSNRTLANSSIALFESDSEGEEAWNNEDRMQALYTLVR